MEDQSKKFLKPVVAGSLAGGLGYVSTLPLDYIKQHLQSDRNVSFKQIKEHGFRSLFRGGLIGCYSIVPQMMIKFSANDTLSRTTNNSPWLNGLIAGYLDGSFLGPVLSVQSMQQMRYDFGYWDSFQQLFKKPKSLLNLSVPMAMRNGTYTSFLFGGHGYFGKLFENKFLNDFAISSILNAPAVVACSPFDVIRAKQIQYLLEDKPTSVPYLVKDIYKRQGLRGFYQGFGSLYINFGLRFPLTFAIFYGLMDKFETFF